MVAGGHHRRTGLRRFLMAAQPSGWQRGDRPATRPEKPPTNTQTSFQSNQTVCFI